jgi:hypothetical protein
MAVGFPISMPSALPFLSRIEGSALAATIQSSTLLNGVLSGVHLLGLTLILGSAIVAAMRLAGVFGEYPVADVTRATRWGSLFGLALSLPTGLLLVAPRVVSASANPTFRLKMTLLCAAVAAHAAFLERATRGRRALLPPAAAGGLTVVLWLGVALAGLAFILLE